MYTISVAVPINDGSEPVLTPDQIWRGLEHHVRTSDLRFVPPGHGFEVIEETPDGVVRRALLYPEGRTLEFVQRVTFHVQRAMVMSTTEPFSLRIWNIEVDDVVDYVLRLTISGQKPGVAHGSPEERGEASVRHEAAIAAAYRHVDLIRQLVRDGEL